MSAIQRRSRIHLNQRFGVVSRAMASGLPAGVQLTVTDLNQPMLDYAMAVGTERPVNWRQADVMDLPFPDGSFDAVVC